MEAAVLGLCEDVPEEAAITAVPEEGAEITAEEGAVPEEGAEEAATTTKPDGMLKPPPKAPPKKPPTKEPPKTAYTDGAASASTDGDASTLMQRWTRCHRKDAAPPPPIESPPAGVPPVVVPGPPPAKPIPPAYPPPGAKAKATGDDVGKLIFKC